MTAQEYSDLYSEPHHHEIQIKVVNSSPEVVFTNADICYETMTLEDSLFSDYNLRIGACESRRLSVKVVSEDSLIGQWIDVYIYTDLPDVLIDSDGNEIIDSDGDNIDLSDAGASPAYTRIGRFKVFSDNRTNDRRWRELVCYDAMYDILNADMSTWYSGLTFPMTISSLRNSFFTYLNITQETVTLPNDSLQIQGGFDVEGGLSGKTVIEAICELNGCFGHITKDGTFKYVLFDTYTEVALDHYIDGTGTYEDYVVDNIDGVIARSAEDDVGTPSATGTMTHPYIINDNPLTYGLEGSDALKTALYNVYTSLRRLMIYRPYKVKTYGNPFLEVGTKITIETRDQTIESFVFCKTMTGIQALRDTISATGDKTLEFKPTSLQSQLIRTKGKVHILENTVDTLKSEITKVSQLSIPILPVTRWIYNTYDDGRVQYQIVDEPELKYLDLTSGSFKFAIKGISLTDYYNAKKKEIYIKKGSTVIQALLWNLDSTVVTTELIADELITIEYGVRGSITQGRFFVLPDSYASALNIKTNTLIQQTADAINLKVSETVHATVPTSNYTDYATDVSTDTITFKFIDLPIFELIDITNSTFRFGMNVPDNFNDTQKARKKAIRIESTSGGTSQVITAPIFNENGTQVTDEIFSGKVVYLERATRTIGSSSVSGFWLYSDSYTQSQINMTKDQIVLKVDSSGNMYKTALGDAASSGSSFKIGANNISFITNGTIEMTSNDIAIESTNFTVDSNGNVVSKHFTVTPSLNQNGAFEVVDSDGDTLGLWGKGFINTYTEYQKTFPSKKAGYTLKSCAFQVKNIYTDGMYDVSGGMEEYIKYGTSGFTIQTVVDPWNQTESERTKQLHIVGNITQGYVDIVNDCTWGVGTSEGLRGTIKGLFRTQTFTQTISVQAGYSQAIYIPVTGWAISDSYMDFIGVASFMAENVKLALTGYDVRTVNGVKSVCLMVANITDTDLNNKSVTAILLFAPKGAHTEMT